MPAAVETNRPQKFSPLFLKLLANRGFNTPGAVESFLYAGFESLLDPFSMKGMDTAVSLLRAAAENKRKILIHGDYDVDGVTAAALMGRTLSAMRADFEIFLPDRAEDGYGVSERAIRNAHAQGISILITVDCGITAFEKIKLARSLGLDVIVIDHHRIPEEGIPPATAILNPRQADCPYVFKELSAAGLVFKLSQALLGDKAREFLDLAALSTVCDVAPLEFENRVIVKKGLQILSNRTNPGIRALGEAAKIKSREFNVGHIGFMLGPRINAAGRMSSPEIALRLLMTDSIKEAESLAVVLEEENKSRQREEKQTLKEALNEVEKTINFNRDRVIVVGREGWHQGVIGIVAARLVDKYHRPAVVIAVQDGKGKGSGRSIKGFHLFNALDACKEHFIEFGGHEQAAGLSIKQENIAAFRAQVNKHALETYDAASFVRKVPVEMELALSDFGPGFSGELKLMEPHGMGNARPVFGIRGLQVKTKPERFGESLKLWLTDGGFTVEAHTPSRGSDDYMWIEKGMTLDIACTVKFRVWDGLETLQLELRDARLV